MSGGTGASTLTGLLQGYGTGAFTAITGTAGQFPYYNGSNTLLATSTLFVSTVSNGGIGTTTPWAKLSVEVTAGTDSFAVGSSTSSYFVVYKNGYRDLPGTGYGLIAEEVGSVDTTLVGYDDEGRPNSVRYTSIIPLLIDAFKDLWAKVRALIESDEAQNARIQQLEEEVAALKSAAGAPGAGFGAPAVPPPADVNI